VLEPWVDTRENSPAKGITSAEVRAASNIEPDGLLVALIGIPDSDCADFAVVTVLDTVAGLAEQGLGAALLVVGDGAWREAVDARALEINNRLGRTIVSVSGDVLDRGAVFASADVVIGTGSSVLHAMAFGKPVIIAGDRGFFRPLSHATVEQFSWDGWHGHGSGSRLGGAELVAALEPLLDSPRLREYRGDYSRELAQSHGLSEAVLRQLQEYRDALDTRVGRLARWVDVCRVGSAMLVRRSHSRSSPRRHHDNVFQESHEDHRHIHC
jgi:hypothetical protein